jgi:hypothetical protein
MSAHREKPVPRGARAQIAASAVRHGAGKRMNRTDAAPAPAAWQRTAGPADAGRASLPPAVPPRVWMDADPTNRRLALSLTTRPQSRDQNPPAVRSSRAPAHPQAASVPPDRIGQHSMGSTVHGEHPLVPVPET